MQVLTNTEGVDFNQYLREVYLSVKKRWFANMPPSVEKGDQGVDSVEFRILQDGSVPKDSLKVVVSSRKTALDEASLQGIREAAPFSHLLEKFSQPFVELRFVFLLQPSYSSKQVMDRGSSELSPAAVIGKSRAKYAS
jgi:hypothetical protein